MTSDPSQLVQLDAGQPAPGSEPVHPGPGQAIFGMDMQALESWITSVGKPAWRARQVADAVYRNRVIDLAQITTLPISFRESLVAAGWQVGRPRIQQVFQSTDGTERYLVECSGGASPQTVETVWMPEGDGGESGDGTEAAIDSSDTSGIWQRGTICVSSQVGCAVNCQFCLTARLGLQRNLTAGEIAGQVFAVFDRKKVEIGRDRINLVFMGMGEPFLNYDNFMAAVRLLVVEAGLSPQRMTVSTSGIVPGIQRFAQELPELRPKLAISLNAPNNEIREQVMPVNRKWDIEAVVEAVRAIKLRHKERITFEYVLLGGVTDQPAHAREVARLVRRTGLPAKVNLIAWNPGPGIPYSMPQPDAVRDFFQTLIAQGIPTYLRRPRGRDIYAACGQLKRTVEG